MCRAQAGQLAHGQKHLQRLANQLLAQVGVVHLHDLAQGVGVGKADVMKKTATQKRVGQFFFIVAGDQDDWPLTGAHLLAGFVDVKFHLVEFAQQVVGKLDVRLVDFVDQQHRRLFGVKRLPQLALDDVVAHLLAARLA